MSSESDLSITSAPSIKQRITSNSQKTGLTRIVKAQVTLLISSLTNDNFTRKLTEIDSLIETHGEDIREHLFRYLLSDIFKLNLLNQDSSPQFRLLKENAIFTKDRNKLEATVSFSLALEQMFKTAKVPQLDLEDLFGCLELDSLDKVIFVLPLFSGVRPDIIEKAKTIFSTNIQEAILTFTNLKSIPDAVLQYLFNLITRIINENTYQFEFNTIQNLINRAAEYCKDKLIIEQIQHLINSKVKNVKTTQIDQQFKQSIIELYMNNPSSVTRILDSIKERNIFPDILETLPTSLALDLVITANQQSVFNLESWIDESLKKSQQKDIFAKQTLDYINQKLALESQKQTTPNLNLPISLPSVALNKILKVLLESSLSPQLNEQLQDVKNRALHFYPELQNNSQFNMDHSTGSDVSFKPDVEKEANLYYERVYKGEMTLDAMVQLLKNLSTSKVARDGEIFACMIHNLFDEYAFFPKYPDKELSITSILFGLLVQHQLVSNSSLSITLRYVIDGLRNPPGSKMFNFGVQALRQFQMRLKEWPQYCAHLLQIPDFVQSQPDLVAQIQSAMNPSQETPPPIETPHYPEPNAYRFTSVRVPPIPNDILYTEPSSAIQDKILFIINNVAHNNIQTKVASLMDVLQPSSFQWFSRYLVVKRISAEPNYHELYILVLDSFNSKELDAFIFSETYSNIIVLLNSKKTMTNSSDRTLLKNLGSWLGKLTLAKNKPILYKNIAFKELLLEGYDAQCLLVVIPFVCKVLEQGSQSKVFRPPNPWLMAILKFLVELYQSADLKLNLKFEIEVLCKSLCLELKDIPPTSILKNRRPQVTTVQTPPVTNPYPLVHDKSLKPNSAFAIPNIAPYIVFNPQIALYTARPEAKRLVLQACTESIKEIMGPVIERAVAISVASTRELVTKDFMMEPNENKMRQAAHLMAQNLAASLAMVTSKEPLRLSIVSNLKTIFLAHGLNDNMAEQAIILTVGDNLEMMCAVIEKAAMEKATVEIDDILISAYLSRKKHQEQRPNQPYVDMGLYQVSGFMNALPAALRPRPNGLQPAQLSIYEHFIRIPRVAPTTNANVMVDRNLGQVELNGNYGGQPLPQIPAHLIVERFTHFITELEALVNQSNANSFNQLPQQSDIRSIIRQIILLAMSSFDKTEATRTFAQKSVQLLYKSEKQLAIEVYVVLLEHLCEVSSNVGALVTSWLTHADDERKYNVPVTVALIKAGLIHLPEQDQELAMLIESGRSSAIEFTVRLIRACLFGEYPLATRQEFMASLEALSRLNAKQVPEPILSLLEDMRRVPHQLPIQLNNNERDKLNDAGLRKQLQLFFAEWVQLVQHPATTEKTLLSFATQLYHQKVFKLDDLSSLFYRICIEASVDHAIKFKMVAGQPQQPSNLAYQPMDALSKLIVSLVQVALLEGHHDPIYYFTRPLSVLVLCISQQHETQGRQFDQRHFLRLLTCILSDLHAAEKNIQSIYLPLLTAFSNTLYTLQPNHFPGFIFAWLQLVSNRFFMPRLLLAENQKGWPTFQRLFICLFQFLSPYLRHVKLQDTTRILYRGALRVLLVILHDFPEFLCDYHFDLCNVIPSTCIQMRNLILSAYPPNMRLPDPFTPNLKIDLLPEIRQSPRILTDLTQIIQQEGLLRDLDQYLETGKQPRQGRFLKELCLKLKQPQATSYDIGLIHAIVLYVGSVAVSKGTAVNQGPGLEIFRYFLSELDSEGRYIFVSAIANQLRYPNNHTYYFSRLLLFLFVESEKEIIKEHITRVLLERLIVNRPHPWGLLITFIELIRNPSYDFWSYSFTRCATDIEKLFESVSRSIN